MAEKIIQYIYLIFSVHTSFRRYAVDSFYRKHGSDWNKDVVCVDVGGKREKRKGRFRIEQFIDRPICLNIDPEVKPDYICDARNMPFDDNYADVIICSEVLEHIDGVDDVLNEIYRVLKQGGKAYLCVPFSMHIHNRPDDYGRYTEFFWKEHFLLKGFKVLESVSQGGYWATKLNMNKRFFKCFRRKNRYSPLLPFVYFLCVIARIIWLLLEQINPMWEIGYTTGYGFVIEKKEKEGVT